MIEEDCEEIVCTECDEDFFESDFDGIDYELDEAHPRCPECQKAHELKGRSCEYCDRPAVEFFGTTPLCEEHLEEYADGMIRD